MFIVLLTKKFVQIMYFVIKTDNPRANGAKRRSGRKPGARVTKTLSTLVRFRLKTHTFRCVSAFRPH